MKDMKGNAFAVGVSAIAAGALLLALGLTGSGCDTAADNFDSRVACRDYCNKEFDCNDDDPTSGEAADCVSACRDSIEDNCGNENQAAANDKIEECVVKDCVGFWACMVFETAPECFDFVGQQ